MNRSSEHRQHLGALGEDLAAAYLQRQGYRLICRNFRCRMGEIDIIAAKAGVITFVEVKTRASQRYGLPAEAVTAAKQKKLRRTAEYYLQQAGMLEAMPPLAFDVIEIVIARGTEVRQFRHYPQCF